MAAGLDALGAQHQRPGFCERRRQFEDNRPRGLRGRGEQQRVAAREIGEVGCRQDRIGEPQSGQACAGADLTPPLHLLAIAPPQRHAPPAGRRGLRQRDAPGAGADDANMIERYHVEPP